MAALTWDAVGEHWYEMGTDHGVLYPMKLNPVAGASTGAALYDTGVAWNGLTGVTDSPDGAEATDIWADNIKYASMRSAEKSAGTIEAYTYPDEFAECDGSAAIDDGVYIGQQTRRAFAFCYRSQKGNDLNSEAGYLLHIYYGCTASPSSKDYATINDSPDAITFSWDFEANPVTVTGHKPSATVVIDSVKAGAANMKKIEDKLYGTNASQGQEATEPTLLLPDEIVALLQ